MLGQRGDAAISDPWVFPRISEWDAHHPEEEVLSLGELHWELQNYDENLSAQARTQIEEHHAAVRVTFRVINGGKPANHDIPYVDLSIEVHEYEYY